MENCFAATDVMKWGMTEMNEKNGNSLHSVLTWLSYFLPNNTAYRNLGDFVTVIRTELKKSKYRDLLREEVTEEGVRNFFKDLGKKLATVRETKERTIITISPEFKALAGNAVLVASPTTINRIKEISRVLFRSADYSFNHVDKIEVKESDKIAELMKNLTAERIPEAKSALNRLYDILKENGL